MLGARQILVGPFFPVKEFLSQIIYEINQIIDLRVISNELILAGKLQLKKLQKKKPEKKNKNNNDDDDDDDDNNNKR